MRQRYFAGVSFSNGSVFERRARDADLRFFLRFDLLPEPLRIGLLGRRRISTDQLRIPPAELPVPRRGLLLLLFFVTFQKVRRPHNRGTSEASQPKQIFVGGDDEIHPGLQGALEDTVVGFVLLHDIQG